MTIDTMNTLRHQIMQRSARVGVIGMGYVGLPLAARTAGLGFPVLGFDVSAERAAALNRGESYIGDVPGEVIARLRADGRFEATTDIARLAECDVLLICVPTPLGQHPRPRPVLHRVGHRTRSPPACARASWSSWRAPPTPAPPARSCCRCLEAGGLAVGARLFLAFSPERDDPGQPAARAGASANIPKVVGGATPACTELAVAFYGQITSQRGAGLLAEAAEIGQAPREHLPGGQHRPGQRAEDALRRAWASTSGR